MVLVYYLWDEIWLEHVVVKSNYDLEIICHKQTTVASNFSNFLQYQHPLIKTHSFELEKLVTHVGWGVSKYSKLQDKIIQYKMK